MARAYLMVWVKTGFEDAVREGLLDIKGVTSADLTTGNQDLIAVIEADTYEDIVQTVLGQVRTLRGVDRTVTSLAVR